MVWLSRNLARSLSIYEAAFGTNYRDLGQISWKWDKLQWPDCGNIDFGKSPTSKKGHLLILWLANIAQCIFVGLSDALNITELSSRKMDKPSQNGTNEALICPIFR